MKSWLQHDPAGSKSVDINPSVKNVLLNFPNARSMRCLPNRSNRELILRQLIYIYPDRSTYSGGCTGSQHNATYGPFVRMIAVIAINDW